MAPEKRRPWGGWGRVGRRGVGEAAGDGEEGVDDGELEVADEGVDGDAEDDHEEEVAGEVHDAAVEEGVGEELVGVEFAVGLGEA